MGKVPKVPNAICSILESDIPYKANYDRLANIVRELGQEYKQENWIKSAELFEKCANNIEMIVSYIIKYCCDGIDEMNEVIRLFLDNAEYASKAYRLILCSN